ncbi:MAG: methyltransferase [Trebonia sp.]
MPLTGRLPELTPAEADMRRQSEALLKMITGHWAAQTVRAAADLRVADHVADGARTAVSVAAREASDPEATFRLMRAMVAIGLLDHEDQGEFAVTAMGQLLREGVRGSLRAAALARSGPAIWESPGRLPQAVREGTNQAEQAVGSTLFEYFARDKPAGQVFSQAMSDLSRQVAEDTVALLDLGSATRVADIGGANGALVLTLLRAHPEATGLLFDLPHVVAGARAAAADTDVADRFSAIAGDFFDTVPEADYYLLKWVLHDWRDEECLRILRACRAAGGPKARMLIIEALVGGTDGGPDPVPLFDMNMLAATEGKQRSLAEFDVLLAASGWQRVAVRRARTMDSLLEAEAI